VEEVGRCYMNSTDERMYVYLASTREDYSRTFWPLAAALPGTSETAPFRAVLSAFRAVRSALNSPCLFARS
jgi:hypothetical protein